jgi:hypothetical protein
MTTTRCKVPSKAGLYVTSKCDTVEVFDWGSRDATGIQFAPRVSQRNCCVNRELRFGEVQRSSEKLDREHEAEGHDSRFG